MGITTQAELERVLGCRRGYLSRIINAKRRTPLALAERVESALGILPRFDRSPVSKHLSPSTVEQFIDAYKPVFGGSKFSLHWYPPNNWQTERTIRLLSVDPTFGLDGEHREDFLALYRRQRGMWMQCDHDKEVFACVCEEFWNPWLETLQEAARLELFEQIEDDVSKRRLRLLVVPASTIMRCLAKAAKRIKKLPKLPLEPHERSLLKGNPYANLQSRSCRTWSVVKCDKRYFICKHGHDNEMGWSLDGDWGKLYEEILQDICVEAKKALPEDGKSLVKRIIAKIREPRPAANLGRVTEEERGSGKKGVRLDFHTALPSVGNLFSA